MAVLEEIRKPAMAGLFYPRDREPLRAYLERLLSDAPVPPCGSSAPKALVAPHAGYRYSGPVAASAFCQLLQLAGRIRRVVLLGPSHHYAFAGLGTSHATTFQTPLGRVRLDRDAITGLEELSAVFPHDAAHAPEHSLEVELPFLQVVLGEFSLVPLVTGEADPEVVAEVLEAAWGGEETLIVVTTDLSHFHSYEEARRIDACTCEAVEALDASIFTGERACCSRHGPTTCGSAPSTCATPVILPAKRTGSSATAPGGFGRAFQCK